MRILTRFLLVSLAAFCLHFSHRVPAWAQQPGTVSVRPRSAANQPGMPEVKVTVDRNRVPLGDEVTFTVSPAHVVADYKVTLFFGDRSSHVMSEPKIGHFYPHAATFTYSILVEPAAPQPKPTPKPTPRPTPALAIPDVKLTAAPNPVEISRPVSFGAQLSHSYPNIRYRFVFGDGLGTDWQTEGKATHAYRSQGSYQAYVDLGVSANGSIKQASGSTRESIQVTDPVRPTNVTVKLLASAASVNVAAPVTFMARMGSQQPNARYRFDFGDQTAPTGWQASSQVRHRYKSAGQFSARAEVRVVSSTGAQSASSNPVSIEVRSDSTAKPSVDLNVIPESVPLGVPVFFRAIPSAADSKTRYRFNFGDGLSSGEWSSSPDLTHAYASPGTYSAFVEIGTAGDQGVNAVAASGQKRVRITPGPGDNTNGNGNSNTLGNTNSNTSANSNTNANSNANGNTNSNVSGNMNGNANSANASPSPSASETPTPNPTGGPTESNDWWKYVIIIAIILFAGYQISSYVFAPRPTFVPHFDPGDADASSLAIDLQMEVDPNVAGGEFRLDTEGGSLIKSERTE